MSPIDPQEAQVTGWHSFGKAASNDADHNYMPQRAPAAHRKPPMWVGVGFFNDLIAGTARIAHAIGSSLHEHCAVRARKLRAIIARNSAKIAPRTPLLKVLRASRGRQT